jgi:hypothetical protein
MPGGNEGVGIIRGRVLNCLILNIRMNLLSPDGIIITVALHPRMDYDIKKLSFHDLE